MSVELGDLVGSGKEAEVFAAGTGNVVKLYRFARGKVSAFREAATLAGLAVSGLPVPEVFSVRPYGERWGIEMRRATGAAFAEQMRKARDVTPWLVTMADLQALIHEKSGRYLPPQRQRLVADITVAPLIDEPLRQRLLDALAELPAGDRLCHGDYHPFNLIGPVDKAVLVDWLDASAGVPAADVCRSYVLISGFDADLARLYVETYAERTGVAVADIALWLPFVAAARLNEGVPQENQRLLELAAGL